MIGEKVKEKNKKRKKNKLHLYVAIRDIAITIIIFSFVAILLIGSRVGINYLYVNAYEEGEYKLSLEKNAMWNILVDPYIVSYNIGNGYYQNGDYESAVVYYENALSYEIPENEECPIRINLALTITKTIDFETINVQFAAHQNGEDIDTELFVKNVQKAIQILKQARSVLTEENCAGETDADGHSAEAESLKKDIDDEIEKLEAMLEEFGAEPPEDDENNDQEQSDDKNEDESSDSSNEDKGEDSREQQIRKELEKQQNEALKEQEEVQESYERYSYYTNQYSDDGSYTEEGYGGKTW